MQINELNGFRADYDHSKRVVKQETVSLNGKNYWISTVDLGIDHGFEGCKGVYWETIIFDEDRNSLHMDRYTSREESLKGHERMKEAFLNNTLREEY